MYKQIQVRKRYRADLYFFGFLFSFLFFSNKFSPLASTELGCCSVLKEMLLTWIKNQDQMTKEEGIEASKCDQKRNRTTYIPTVQVS